MSKTFEHPAQATAKWPNEPRQLPEEENGFTLTDLKQSAQQQATEKPRAIAAFEPYLQSLSGPTNLDEVLTTTKTIEDEISPTYPYSGIQAFLMQYYGVELLPYILPDVKRLHIAADNSGAPDTTAHLETYMFQDIPKTLHGVPVNDLCNTIGSTILTRGRDTVDKITRVDGMCGVMTSECLYDIALQYREASKLVQSRIELRLEGMPSRRTLPEEPGKYLRVLGMGHSLFGFSYRTEDGTPMVLSVDPTIAQVDQTQTYDIELAAIPRDDYNTFLKLRYRSVHDIEPIWYTKDAID